MMEKRSLKYELKNFEIFHKNQMCILLLLLLFIFQFE